MTRLFSKLLETYTKLEFPTWCVPLAFLGVSILSFGLVIPDLGFYMDDWSYVFYAKILGSPGLQEMLLYDSRPFAAWLYVPAFQLFGFNPINWQIAILILRWATAVIFWLTLDLIWPHRLLETTTVGVLFVNYPFFMFQPAALGSTHHWAGFLLFGLSLYLMVLALRKPKHSIWMMGLALILEGLHLFTSEYFSGLELLRPVVLWIILSSGVKTKDAGKLLWKLFIRWLPYLLVLGSFAYWRVVLFENPPGVIRNEPVILNQLIHEPLTAILFILSASIKDALAVLTIGWQKATDVSLLDLATSFNVIRSIVGIFSFFIVVVFLNKLNTDKPVDNPGVGWSKHALAISLVALLSAGLPFWLVGRTISESKNLESASRVGIPAMFGAAFLIGWVIHTLVTERIKRVLVLSILVAVAINFQLANARGFRFSWEKQTRFYQELIWRAPRIDSGTAIITDQEVLPYMGEYATSYAINTIYNPWSVEAPPYWYFPIYYSYPDINSFLQGIPIEYEKFTMKFTGVSTDSLVIAFEPGLDQCLWLLRPEDINLRLVSEDLRRLSAISAIDRISQSEDTEVDLPKDIFTRSRDKGWCYYFEKGDLARQYGEWERVIELWEEAMSHGIQPGNGFEYIPFIEAYGHAGNWNQVAALMKTAKKITQGLEPSLCTTTDQLISETPGSLERDKVLEELRNNLNCENF